MGQDDYGNRYLRVKLKNESKIQHDEAPLLLSVASAVNA